MYLKFIVEIKIYFYRYFILWNYKLIYIEEICLSILIIYDDIFGISCGMKFKFDIDCVMFEYKDIR